ncbi:MAG: hypothetical protein D9N13_01410 [Ketobacter sp. GenoA1]|nr:MAG: hypothetical protein D9N13_01410 [Ketobacter sp. GenoA1]RLT98532.1 MAG: hypothetical protein D9N15_06615 [Ketobacter sp.]
MVSLFSRLKVELIYPTNYRTIEVARLRISAYIENFYNCKISHS